MDAEDEEILVQGDHDCARRKRVRRRRKLVTQIGE